MIGIIDYGMGNIHSVCNALDKIEAAYIVSNDKELLKKCHGLILPGVGAFPQCMDNLKEKDLIAFIKEEVYNHKPLLGICLGMQALFEESDEVINTKGLGLLKGKIIYMDNCHDKVPHVGWNKILINHTDEVINDNTYAYFVHSYYVSNYDEDNLMGYVEYGNLKIPAYVRKGNILGMQFHPEKSGKDGLKMLKIFKEMCDDYNTGN